jgi:hypothetical protein
MNWKLMMANLKTTIAGILGFLLSIPIFVQAIEDWGNHRPVNWVQVAIGVGMWAYSHGLMTAKDDNTHSTVSQVEQATTEARVAASKVG